MAAGSGVREVCRSLENTPLGGIAYVVAGPFGPVEIGITKHWPTFRYRSASVGAPIAERSSSARLGVHH
jgi:hypothetical protein